MPSLLDRLDAPGPKRLLALDGGGIRGVVTLGFLVRIEQLLRERADNPSYVLSDYFDLIGGTSTGGIIAAALAQGVSAVEMQEKYLELGARVFGKRRFMRVSSLFDAAPLEAELKGMFGTRTLSDKSLRTGLCIVAKRADTESTWPLMNHPRSRFYDKNKDMPIWSVVRASAAAPGYFIPQQVDVGGGEAGMFIDGGVSMACNPALQLFMVATLKGFPFRWPLGEENLLMVSVGTGSWKQRTSPQAMAAYKLWDWASAVPRMLMNDSSQLNETVLQCLSSSPTARRIDSEVGTLADDLWSANPILTYLRYDVALEENTVRELGVNMGKVPVAETRRLDRAEHRHLLRRIGDAAAARAVDASHFPAAFDPR
jgi:uncharacterized protein